VHIIPIPELAGFREELTNAAARTAAGWQKNTGGKLLGLFLKKIAGADSPNGPGDNFGTIEGEAARFTTADGKGFSLNPTLSARTLIFASYKGKPTSGKPLKCNIVGLRVDDILTFGKTTKGKGTERVSVMLHHLPQSKVVSLGVAYVPAKYIEADSVEGRKELEKEIAALTDDEVRAMVVAGTQENIRAYILAGRELPAPPHSTAETPPPDGGRSALGAPNGLDALQAGEVDGQ
jgi:hypothetical protein